MDEQLPDDFNVIIVGTGLTESIVSGALSRSGKKVLHLDHMKSYGSDWSSFNLKAFEERMRESTESSEEQMPNTDIPDCVDTNEEIFVPIKNHRQTISGGSATCHIKEQKKKDVEDSVKEDIIDRNEAIATSCDADGDTMPTTVSVLQEAELKGEQVGDDATRGTTTTLTTDTSLEETKPKEELQCDAGHLGEEKIENEQLPQPLKEIKSKDESLGDTAHLGEKTVENVPDASNVEVQVEKLPDKKSLIKDNIDKKSKEYFYSKWRHFNLDLTPKLMFSRGKLVELLIVSNVCRYLEFRNVTGTLTMMEEHKSDLVPVPCSRKDIFNSNLVSLVEKRLLMRILTTCANYKNHPDEYAGFEDRPFIEFLASKKLSKKLQHFIIHSVAMVTEETKTLDGLKASENFLKSLGRYGNGAFLWTTYGVGELPQAFCRLGAVFGGTFCLNRFARGIVLSKTSNRCIGIVDSTGQRLKCDHLVLNEMYLPESCRTDFVSHASRAIYVTDSSFADSGNANACLISIPPTSGIPPTWLIEVSSSCCVCPADMYVVHAMMRVAGNEVGHPKSDFSKLENLLFDNSEVRDENQDQDENDRQKNENAGKSQKPKILWSSYFSMTNNGCDMTKLPDNVSILKGPCFELGFDETVMEARALFESICPNEEFLPRAPNPEEIIYFDQNDEGYNTENNGSENHTIDQTVGEYQEGDDEMYSEAVETPGD